MAEVKIVKIIDFKDKSRLPFLEDVSEYRRLKIGRYLKSEDAYRSLLGELLARYMLCEKLRCCNSKLRFGTGAYGKPYLVGEKYCFNISHSGNHVAAILDDGPVGIDLEYYRNVSDNIAKYFLNKSEYEYLSEISDRVELRKQICMFWTMKEAYIKALGRGMNKGLLSITVKREKTGEYRIIDEEPYSISGIHAAHMAIDHQCCMSSISFSGSTVVEITDEELIADFSIWR